MGEALRFLNHQSSMIVETLYLNPNQKVVSVSGSP